MKSINIDIELQFKNFNQKVLSKDSPEAYTELRVWAIY